MTETTTTCAVGSCEFPSRSLGLCSTHYARKRRTGDPLGSKPRAKRPAKPCNLSGCPAKHYAHGYCEKHSYSFKRYGDPLCAEHMEARKAMLVARQERECSSCGEVLSISSFPKNASSTLDACYSKCRECLAVSNREDYLKNRESRILAGAKWRADNPHKAKEKYLANKDYYLERAKRRKASLRGDGSERGISVSSLRKLHGDSCCYCECVMVFNTDSRYVPTKATLEHVLPLSRGGKHTFANCRLACYSCNLSKNNKTVEEWAA